MRAVSLASVPELVKNTLASGMPDNSAIFSASSICGSMRYRVEVWTIFSACALIASTISGTLYPVIVVRIPPKKSRYVTPSASVTLLPLPSTREIGCSEYSASQSGITRWWRARSSEWTLIRSLPSDFRIPARISWLHQWLVGVGTTVAVERPDAAHLLDHVHLE